MTTEKDFQRQVIDLARIYGYDFIYHPLLSKWSEKGWPDLVLCRSRDGRMLYAELKAERGKVTEAQHRVHEVLLRCGQDVRVWRPSDFDEIARVLA